MSTKTTFKRIALVAVAALGFGVLTSVAPATAAQTLSFATDKSSITIVKASGDSTQTDDNAVIAITVTGTDNTGLQAGETITASVVGVPTAVTTTKTVAANAADLTFLEVKQSATNGVDPVWTGGTAESANETDGAIGSANTAHYAMNVKATADEKTAAAAAKSRTYYLAVVPGSNKTVYDQGAYTIRLRLTDVSGIIVSDKTFTVDWVSSDVTAGAKLAIDATGTYNVGSGTNAAMALANQTDLKYLSASITNRDGGRIVTSAGAAPAITAWITDATATAPVRQTLTAADSGAATLASELPDQNAIDGVYSLTLADFDGAEGTATISASYGNSAVATGTVTVLGAATAVGASAAPTVVAAGISVLDTGTPWVLPLTTKEATAVVYACTATCAAGTVVGNHPIDITVTWSGNYNAGDVSPKSESVTRIYTDANGKASLKLTNANPTNGAVATISFSNFTSAGNATSQVINWESPKVTYVTVSPSSQKVAFKSTNAVTVTVQDQFLAPVVGEVLQPSLSSTSANYSATALATLKTDASGQASFSLTDAAATATVASDALTFTSTTDKTKSGSVTFSYVTAVPVIGGLTGYYNLDQSGTASTLVPTTGIYADASGTNLLVTAARDYNKIISTTGTSATDDQVKFRFKATTTATGTTAATGVPVTVTAGDGGYLVNATTGLKSSSLTLITSTATATAGEITFVAGATKTGAITFTIKGQDTTATAAMWVANALGDARNVTLKAGATAGNYTASVTDRFGNAVSGVTLNIQVTGNSKLGTGGKSVQWTTTDSGQYNFDVIGTDAAVQVTATTGTTANQMSDSAGYVSTTEVTGLTAGNKTATVAAAVVAPDSTADNAQAAVDAAAEATDAANAATDAANAAAEAADAATAAAQDAADAVAALSTQVSEMVNALKKQITALTNLVIKIQKKVKA